jgi:drug/metabolite transporter (DMT)-like permease
VSHMHTFQAAVLLGLLAATSWGISDFLIGRSSRVAGAMKGAFLVNTYGAIVYGVIFLPFLFHHPTFTTEGIYYAIAGGVFFGMAQATFFKAMSHGPVGLVSAVSSTYPLITLLVAVAFYTERLSIREVFGILLIVGGVMVASGLADKKVRAGQLGKGPLFALIPTLGWGVGYVFIAKAVASMGWGSTLFVELLITPISLVALIPFIKGDEHFNFKSLRAGWKLPSIWGAAIIQMAGLLVVNMALAKVPGRAAVIIAVSSCYPALTIFLAFRHLQERIPLLPLIGGLVGILGVMLLALG